MISIYDYIYKIYTDFSEYIDKSKNLCDLKSLTFESGNIPDYTNIHIQQLYLLRYTFSYAFEYKYMYSQILREFDPRDKLKVLSLGCGSMTDYWSLSNVCDLYPFEYFGVDALDWHYMFEPVNSNIYHFIQKDMINYIKEAKVLDFDIYFFPKSLCELKNNDILKICYYLRTKPITKDKIVIGASLRSDNTSLSMDLEKSKQIIDAIEQSGFYCISNKAPLEMEHKAIISFDKTFRYPDVAKELLKNIFDKCLCEKDNCTTDCQELLNRSPTLRTDYIRYQILEFERKE